MRTLVRCLALTVLCVLVVPGMALAQSAIAGIVKDASGAVLPGATVEVSSPALIEKTRTAVTDGTGQYKIIELRPGTYSITFTLTGFNTVKRDGIELTSDFTATINAEMKVGAVQETITVTAESPIVDVSSITTRTVMTREVIDSIPSGRNIQAVGILIPGTNITVGGGGAISRDVGGSGNLQQSPLQYRGSGDAVQTIDGMRLNNLCANGAYSGVYWNQGSFEELSYVTGADSAQMGQGGIRINMVPKDGGNQFRGSIFGNVTPESWVSDNCNSPGVGQACTSSNLFGDRTFNPNNFLTNVSKITKNYDFNAGAGGPIARDKVWWYATFRYLGVDKTVADSFYDADSNPFKYAADFARPGIDDGHIRSIAGRATAQITQKDKVSYYHDEQDKVRGHWGIGASGIFIITPEAAAIQATPTSFVSVSKWTRPQTNRLLFDVGFAVYDQEYQENYPASVFAGPVPLVSYVDQSSGNRVSNAWNNPADHFSKLFTEQFGASYVTGAHDLKFGVTISQARWRLVQQWTGDVSAVTYNGLLANGSLNPTNVTLRIPTDRRNSIKNDSAVYAQDKWTFKRATINAGLRWDWFITEVQPETLPASRWNPAVTFDACPDGINNLSQGCVGEVLNWKDISPRLGVAYDLFGNGKTAVKASVARYLNGVGLAGTSATDDANPQISIGATDTRAWRDLDGNLSPFDANGNIQLNELTPSAATPNFGKNIPSTTTTDPAVLNGWGVRGYNWEYAISVQHELARRISINGAWSRRQYGNQTLTVDQRYSFDKNSYDGPFCANAPLDPNLPGGGGYQVCGLYDLKSSVVGLPQSSLITFSSNYGGETNVYEGFEFSIQARPKPGAFLQGGIAAGKRTFDRCNLVAAGILSAVGATNSLAVNATEVAEIFPDGTRACHQDLPYRPDFKLAGSYALPFDFILSGTYQYVRGVQNGGGLLGVGAPSILATWGTTPASATTLGHGYSAGATTKQVNLMAVGENYGNSNLSQLDLKIGRRFRFDRYTLRVDFDAYNIFNSDWPFSLSNAFSTAASSAWLRPTNVLQSRFFKIGAQFDF
jgi:hypothetical protein